METTSAKFSELESIQFAAAIVHKSPHIASIQHKSIITRLTQTKLSLQGSPLLDSTNLQNWSKIGKKRLTSGIHRSSSASASTNPAEPPACSSNSRTRPCSDAQRRHRGE